MECLRGRRGARFDPGLMGGNCPTCGAIVGSDDDAVLPRASWSFDERAHRLVYRVGRYARFDGLEGPADRIELSVALVYADRDGNGAFDAARDRFEGLKLDAVSPYSWPE